MAINFPSSPTHGNTYSYEGVRYTYLAQDGTGTAINPGYWTVTTQGTYGVATGAEIDLGLEDIKYISPLALEGSKYERALAAVGTSFDDTLLQLNKSDVQGALEVGLLRAQAGRKNLLINGRFDIWQRGGGPFVAGYSADRWNIVIGVTSVDQTLADSRVPTSRYAMRVNRTVAGSVSISQKIEAINSASLSGVQATLSMKPVLQTGSVDSIKVSLSRANSYDDFSSVTLIESITISNPNMLGSTLEFVSSILPNEVKFGLEVVVEYITSNSTGVDIKFHEVQLESGPVATEFEYRPIAEELTFCKRYYQHVGIGYTLTTVPEIYANSGSFTEMRVTPSIEASSTLNGGTYNISPIVWQQTAIGTTTSFGSLHLDAEL